jgi:hypothetical protein
VNKTTYSFLLNKYRTFTILKKIISISFIIIFLFANTEIGEILKLPNLIHHYIEHEESNNDISFVDFLNIHYNKNTNHSDNKHDHQNLPFKTVCSHSVNTIIAFENQTFFSFRKIILIPSKIKIPFCQQFYSSFAFANIWQPPKLF